MKPGSLMKVVIGAPVILVVIIGLVSFSGGRRNPRAKVKDENSSALPAQAEMRNEDSSAPVAHLSRPCVPIFDRLNF
jgi:hypothetical protein